MALSGSLTRNNALPDSSAKADFYQLIDGATVNLSGQAGSSQLDLSAIAQNIVMSGKAINEAGTSVASATTPDIGAAAGNSVTITGTTTITGFATAQAGVRRELVFASALILTYNATSLILPTAANITTAAGDCATFISEGSGNWRCTKYQTASGSPLLQSGAKNIVINGNFDIWQRGTSFAAPTGYTADRWGAGFSGAAVVTVSRDTSVPAVSATAAFSNFSFKVAVTTQDVSIGSTDIYAVTQPIEGYSFERIAQKAFTLSFWVKAHTTGIYCVGFRNGGGDRSYVAEYTINSADTWEKKTITVPASPSAGGWSYTNSVGLVMYFPMAAGSTYQTTANAWNTGLFVATANQVNGVGTTSDYLQLSQVQVELGSTANAFATKSISEEMRDCERFFEKSYSIGQFAANSDPVGSTVFVSRGADQQDRMTVPLRSRKRSAPTVTLYAVSSGTTAKFRNIDDSTDLAAATIYESEAQFTAYPTSNTTSGKRYGFHWYADAEL